MKQSTSTQTKNTYNVEHIIIGTAGHIDHGKTSLVKALTGIDTDRLPEEKQRGMTIDLGYAYLDLDSGQRVSIVDVPGHERFVKNMLAGATSINLVLFVIAADDGIMPQTIEHLEIINLLGIKYGLIALTKKDLVTDEWLNIVREDIKNILKGTSLENAPIIPVSTLTGDGIEDCKATIKNLIARIKTSGDVRIFRLSIDRSFTIEGYGCVVTGPVMGGQISVEDEVEIVPIKNTVRVRGIEVTGKPVKTVFVGQRAAINLSGIKSNEVKRGYELSVPGYLQPTNIVDASLRLIKSAKAPLKNRTRIRFHINTAEVMGRIMLLDRDQLNPGEEALCQFLLENLITTEREDRFIIRSYSPAHTIGGGKILSGNTKRLKRFKEDTLNYLKVFTRGNLTEIIEYVFLNTHAKHLSVDDISRQINIHPSVAGKIIDELIKKNALLKYAIDGKQVVFHKTRVQSLKDEITAALKIFHKQHPLKAGIEETQLKTMLDSATSPQMFTAAFTTLKNEKTIKVSDNKIALMGFQMEVSTQEKGISDKIEDFFLKAGLTPPSPDDLNVKFGSAVKSAIPILTEQKKLIEVERGMYFHAQTLEKIKEIIREYIKKNGPMSAAQFRDITKTTRKYAIPLLEYFDAIHFTKRTGDVRILL
jgi:selenocysteine-specific elongation factor